MASPAPVNHQGYTIRAYRDDDEAAFLRVLIESFGGWPYHDIPATPLEHLRWKMRSHPEAAGRHYVAEIGRELAGTRLTTVQALRAGDSDLLLRQGVDSAVHPAHRAHGLMSVLKRYEEDALKDMHGLQLIGQSRHPAMVRLRDEMGYTRFRNRVETMRREGPAPAAPSGDWSIECADGFDERANALWEEARAAFDFAIVRSAFYLNWRYDRRAGHFTIRTAQEGGRLLGYAVHCVRQGVGYIADLLALPGRDDVLRALIADAVAQLEESGAETVECWTAERHPYRDALVGQGFTHRKWQRAFGYRPLNASAADLAFLAKREAVIYVSPGDVDWI